jgi:hypothetical protein
LKGLSPRPRWPRAAGLRAFTSLRTTTTVGVVFSAASRNALESAVAWATGSSARPAAGWSATAAVRAATVRPHSQQASRERNIVWEALVMEASTFLGELPASYTRRDPCKHPRAGPWGRRGGRDA